jgi:hypothetical protein
VLSAVERRAYARDGFVKLEAAFAPDLADRCRARLWDQLEETRDDPSTWTRPSVRLGAQLAEPFREAVASARWVAAIHEVAGPAAAPCPYLGGTVLVRFPVDGDPGDDGWHVDGTYDGPDGTYWLNHHSDGRALLMLVLLSDIGVDDAPTRIRVGSHADLPAVLEPFGDAGVSFLGVRFPPRVHEREIALATGRAGDAYLCHPFLVHGGQRHHGHEPRFLAQPGVPWKSPRPRG